LPSIFNAPPRNRRGIGTVAIEINLSSSGCSFGQSASERQAGSKHCHRLAGGAARVPARPGSARHDRGKWTISIKTAAKKIIVSTENQTPVILVVDLTRI